MHLGSSEIDHKMTVLDSSPALVGEREATQRESGGQALLDRCIHVMQSPSNGCEILASHWSRGGHVTWILVLDWWRGRELQAPLTPTRHSPDLVRTCTV